MGYLLADSQPSIVPFGSSFTFVDSASRGYWGREPIRRRECDEIALEIASARSLCGRFGSCPVSTATWGSRCGAATPWWASLETSCQTLYLQFRVGLRAELDRCDVPRSRPPPPHTARWPAGAWPAGALAPRLNTSLGADCTTVAENRAVPSHWQSELVLRQEKSQIAKNVERAVRLMLLVPLPIDRRAQTVRGENAPNNMILPELLRRTLVWGPG